MAPDPDQIIGLSLAFRDDVPQPTSVSARPTATPFYYVGEEIIVETGVIVDHNQNPVPDGTGVRFFISAVDSGEIIASINESTIDGIATTTYDIENPGLHQITAESDPAKISVVLQVDITDDGVTVTVIPPVTEVNLTPSPTPPMLTDIDPSYFTLGTPGISGWFTMVILLSGTAFLAFFLVGRHYTKEWGFRSALCLILGGLAAYNYLALKLPGSITIILEFGLFGIIGVILIGASIGFGSGWLWSYRLAIEQRNQQADS
jgi:hypothetical protein